MLLVESDAEGCRELLIALGARRTEVVS